MEAIRKCRLCAVSQKMKNLRGKLTPQIIPSCEEVNLVRALNPRVRSAFGNVLLYKC